jgi:hypothetical protein
MFSLLVEQLAKFVESSSSYIIITIFFAVGWLWMSKGGSQQRIVKNSINGSKVEDEDETSPFCLSVNGIVFNLSKAKDFYGAGGPYECFAGRECGVSLAKMSFEETHLDDLEGFSIILNHGEKCEPYSWIKSLENFDAIQL